MSVNDFFHKGLRKGNDYQGISSLVYHFQYFRTVDDVLLAFLVILHRTFVGGWKEEGVGILEKIIQIVILQ